MNTQRTILVLLTLLASDALAIDIIAHRGYSCGAEENSIRAIQNAWQSGADAVELDVRISKDGIFILFHDDKLADHAIADTTYSDIVALADTPVPRLSDVFKLGNPPGYYLLDLKSEQPADYDTLPATIADSNIDVTRIRFQSTNLRALDQVEKAMPDSQVYYLSHLKRRFPFFRLPSPTSLLRKIDTRKLDGVSLKGRQTLDSDYIQKIQAAGYRVNIWTINEPTRATFYRDSGADGVITDAVELIQSHLFPGSAPPEHCTDSHGTRE